MSKTATAPRTALDCDTPRAARPAARPPRLPCSPAPAVPSETTAAGNGGIGLPPPARRLAVRRGSTSLRSVVFPLPLALPSLPPIRIKTLARPLGAEFSFSVNRHTARRHSRLPHQRQNRNHREKHHAEHFEIIDKRQHRLLALVGVINNSVC